MRVLLEGRPGAGKTTVAVRLGEVLTQRGVEVRGFVTRELRERGRRVGFVVETMDGRSAQLAHVSLSRPPRVGKYGVDLEAFERVALPSLKSPPRKAVVLVDELGKMELASERFREAVMKIFDAPGSVVATVHVFRHPFTDSLKQRADVERVTVTRANRESLPEQIADQIA